MKPLKELLKKELKNLSMQDLLPSGYQRIGDIIIINLKKELWKYDRKIGEIILENSPYVRTVCRRTNFITGRTRRPHIKVVAGSRNTETMHKEHGILYKLDVKEVMFSKGNLLERKRLISLIKRGEAVIDMFTGIGYFSLGIAKKSSAERIYAIEVDPTSYSFLKENIALNGVGNIIMPILGNCKDIAPKLRVKADRIIMGLLPSPKDYLDTAINVLKNGGIIHYHSVLPRKKTFENLFNDLKKDRTELIGGRRVKSYAPKVDHVVLDIKYI